MRSAFTPVLALVFAAGALACSSSSPKTGGTAGGSAGAGGAAGTTGSAGATGSAGTTGASGTGGSAGTTGTGGRGGGGGTAGTSGSSGTTGSAGTTGTGGRGGAGGTAGSAGTTGTGGRGGAGGTGGTAGSAGATGTGGRGGAAGSAGTSGTGGRGGTSATGGTGGGGGTTASACDSVPASARVTAWTADSHFCMIRWATNVTSARQLAFAPNGDLFVGGNGRLTVLYDTDGNGVSDASERSTFATVTGGNHSVAFTSTHVYASSDTTVYRWTYTSGQRTSTGSPETVVRGIGTGGHVTRTLLIDGQTRLYVSIGSASNVDAPADPNTPPATRAQIRRFNLAAIPSGGYLATTDGELFAAGLRNEVGLTLDSQGRMWGVENGRDDLMVGGTDIHYDNPGEEVNQFDPTRPGRNYGYPFCWSEGIWTGAMAKGTGTQHLDPDQPGAFTEARCQDASVVVPPALAMRAHLAPLDIVEYAGTAYPAEYRGNLFVASHGSWNREIGQVGRLIIRLRMGANGPTQADNFLGEADSSGALREGQWTVRPVSVEVDPAGLLTFSDDNSGTINKIGYRP